MSSNFPAKVLVFTSVFDRDPRAVKQVTLGTMARLRWVLMQALSSEARSMCVSLCGRPIAEHEDPWVYPADEIRVCTKPGDPASLVLTAVALIASFAANQFLASRVPALTSSSTPEEQRAGFGAISNDAFAGEVIPLVFGTHKRWGGKVIARVPGEAPDGSGKETLRLLVCLGHGPFARIGNQTTNFNALDIADVGGIEVNEQSAEAFAGWRVWGRMGTEDQTPIPGFEDVQLTREVGAGGVILRNTSGSDRSGPSPSGEAFSITTVNAVNSFVLRVRLQEGLYRVDSEAQVESTRVAYRYRWRVVAGAWSDWTVVNLEAASQSPFWSSPRVAIGDAATIEVQAERVTAESSDLSIKNQLLWGNLVEVIDAEENYAGLALVGLEIVAGEQVQNEPRLSFDVDGFAKCKVWDGESPADAPVFIEAFSRNPAWQALTYLLNPVWGAGGSESLSSVHIPSLFEVAEESDVDVDVPDAAGSVARTRPKYACDLIITEKLPTTDQIRTILSTCFTQPIKTGKVWRFIMDKARSIPTETFTDGSIAMDGDGIDAVPGIVLERGLVVGGVEVPNQVIAQFDNAFDRDRPDTYEYPELGDLWLGGENAEPVNAKEIRLRGVKDPHQAMTAAVRELNQLRFRSRTVKFPTTHVDVSVLPGERFDLASGLVDWGVASGRVLADATTTRVRIDRSVTFISGFTYSLRVIHTNNTEEVRPIDMPVGTYQRGVPLQLASALSLAPVHGAEYVVEQSGNGTNVAARPFICTGITAADTEQLSWVLEGFEYVDFYDDLPGPRDETPYSGLVHDLIAPGPLETLRAYERRNVQTGQIQAELAWSQRPEDAANTMSFRVYRRVTGTTTWVQIPEAVVTRRSAVLDIIRADRGYDFVVVAVSSRGVALSVNDRRHPIGQLALGTTGTPPEETITGVTLTRISGNTYTLSWNEVFGAIGYIVYSGAEPDGGVFDDIKDAFIVARVNVNRLEGLRLPTGVSRFYVRSVASNGRMSFNQANTSVDNTFAPLSMTVKHTHTMNFASGVTNVASVSGAYAPSDVNEDAVCESGEIDTGSDTACQVTLRFRTANRAQDPDIDEFLANVPSIEADQWGTVNDDLDVGMIFPPFPDNSHQFIIEIATKQSGVYGPWQQISPYALVSGVFRYYKLRVTWRRGAFPYRPAIVSLHSVIFN